MSPREIIDAIDRGEESTFWGLLRARLETYRAALSDDILSLSDPMIHPGDEALGQLRYIRGQYEDVMRCLKLPEVLRQEAEAMLVSEGAAADRT